MNRWNTIAKKAAVSGMLLASTGCGGEPQALFLARGDAKTGIIAQHVTKECMDLFYAGLDGTVDSVHVFRRYAMRNVPVEVDELITAEDPRMPALQQRYETLAHLAERNFPFRASATAERKARSEALPESLLPTTPRTACARPSPGPPRR